MFKKIYRGILLFLCISTQHVLYSLDFVSFYTHSLAEFLNELNHDEMKQLSVVLQKERQAIDINLQSLRLHAQEQFALSILKVMAKNIFIEDSIKTYRINFAVTDASGIPLLVIVKKYKNYKDILPAAEEHKIYELYAQGKIGIHYAELLQIFLQMKYHHHIHNELTAYVDQHSDVVLDTSEFELPYKIPSFLAMMRAAIKKIVIHNQWKNVCADLKKSYTTYNAIYTVINSCMQKHAILPLPLLCEQNFDIPLLDIKKKPVCLVEKQPLVPQSIPFAKSTIFPWKKIDKRVSIWFEDSTGEKALEFLQYALVYPFVFQSKDHKKSAIFAHTFSRVLDQIIVEITCAHYKEPFQVVGKNVQKEPFWLLSVPVFLEYKDGTKEQGYISYAISQKGILFHRGYAKTTCFDNETKDFLDTKLQEFDYDHAFEQQHNESISKALFSGSTSSWSDEGSILAQEQSFIIEDQRHAVRFIVPRMFTEDEVHATEFYKRYQNRCQRICKK